MLELSNNYLRIRSEKRFDKYKISSQYDFGSLNLIEQRHLNKKHTNIQQGKPTKCL